MSLNLGTPSKTCNSSLSIIKAAMKPYSLFRANWIWSSKFRRKRCILRYLEKTLLIVRIWGSIWKAQIHPAVSHFYNQIIDCWKMLVPNLRRMRMNWRAISSWVEATGVIEEGVAVAKRWARDMIESIMAHLANINHQAKKEAQK